MRYHITSTLLVFLPLITTGLAQGDVDTLPAPPRGRISPERQIAECRRQIQQAFEADDRAEVQFWMDSLLRSENPYFITLYWDERWLLYLWLENYAAIFMEVPSHQNTAVAEEYKFRPPKDSLFEVLDQRLYEERFALFDRINRAWLSAEERAFAALLTSYLLRLNITEEDQTAFDSQLDAFLRQYPQSRFRKFILAKMYHQPRPGDWGIGFDLQLTSGEWSERLGRSFSQPFLFEIGVFVLKKRCRGGGRLGVGGMSLRRTIVHRGWEWFEGDPATFVFGELEVGYLLLQRGRLQLTPVLAGGYAGITASVSEEDEYPEYYADVFRFNGWHYTAALQAELSFNRNKNIAQSSYHGLSLRVGHRWLNLSEGNPAMRGNLLFISLGYTLFGRQALR